MVSIFRSKTALVAVAVLSICTLGLLGASKVNASYVQECDSNAIMRCGAGTAASFIDNAKKNSPSDLQTIYAASGLPTSEYDRFVKTAETGTVDKASGNIVVDGQTVMTNVWSFGREPRANQWTYQVGGKTYYASYSHDMMTVPSTPVMVMFDKTGKAEFSTMNACGNPMHGKVVTPTYSCDLLQKTAVAGKKDTYSFTTKASAANNAKVAKFVYDFGDGTTATETSGSTAVEHTYTKPGTYTTTVTVYVNLPGSNTATVTSAKCKTEITVAQPPKPYQACVALYGALLDKDQLKYEFSVTTKQGNGSTLKNASFDFGDGVTANNVAPTNGTTVKAPHQYAKEGKYTVVATVNFTTASGVQTATCKTAVDTGTTPPPACKYNANLPENSPECKAPCTSNSALPADSPQCAVPKELVNTGAGSMIGLFLGTSVAGSALYRWRLMRRAIRG